MYVSPFEHPAELNERQRDAAKDQFKELFEDSPTVWDDEYECLLLDGVGNHPVRVVPDFSHGLLTVDVDLAIDITEDNVTELQAFARFNEAFKLKYGSFSTAPAGMPVSEWGWRLHEQLHFCLGCRIGAWDMPVVLQMPIKGASDLYGDLVRVANGAAAFEVIANDGAGFLRRRGIIQHLRDYS